MRISCNYIMALETGTD
ncbi:hypothetical protein C5167_002174 [Papaver somniferum]|uniref:Uncharacterized protein n=1 Tax=Papaver somniferum TaxID=3469 RepID=A0A4Y7L015_PAPSO|nr:hypothetical protein C5167_002174 [Papaver somniferum]